MWDCRSSRKNNASVIHSSVCGSLLSYGVFPTRFRWRAEWISPAHTCGNAGHSYSADGGPGVPVLTGTSSPQEGRPGSPRSGSAGSPSPGLRGLPPVFCLPLVSEAHHLCSRVTCHLLPPTSPSSSPTGHCQSPPDAQGPLVAGGDERPGGRGVGCKQGSLPLGSSVCDRMR